MEAELLQLLVRYAALVDAHAWEEAADLFVDGAVLLRPTAPQAPLAGRAAILAAFRARPPRQTRHQVSDVVVEMRCDDAARVRSRVLLQVDGAAPLEGRYEDVVVRAGGQWLFLHRRGFLQASAGDGADRAP